MRFLGINGYSVIVPGISNFDETYANSFGVKVIAGTSDVLDPGRARLQEAAKRYAKAYNQLLARRIASLPQYAVPPNAPSK
jgi:hypothetical protein